MAASDMPTSPGIYRIVCVATKKFYIGSTVNLLQRKREHIRALRHNYHPNPKLQAAWNKYGEQSFVVEIIELILLPEMLIPREQHYLDTLKPFGRKGFNLAPVAGSSLGREVSPETRKKISDANRGRVPHNLGVKHTPEARAKMSATKRSKPNPWVGRKHTEESLRKMSEAASKQIRTPASPETKEKWSAPLRRTAIMRRKTLIVTSPDGIEQVIHGISPFCKEHHLNHANLLKVAYGICSHCKGWKARFPDN